MFKRLFREAVDDLVEVLSEKARWWGKKLRNDEMKRRLWDRRKKDRNGN
jgi:hypothetical protein